MADPSTTPALHGAPERARFEAGNRLTASDLNLEHRYRTGVLRRHLRLVHGWGVVCGLPVVALDDPKRPWLIRVCPGYGVGPCGDEIVLARGLDFDLAEISWRRLTAIDATRVYISLRFLELPARLLPEDGCSCESSCGDGAVASRIRDAAEVIAGWALPGARISLFDLCSGDQPPCPECPPGCELPLASVVLPDSLSDPITDSRIDNSIRRFL
jgi:hypothetical protein